MFYWEGLIGFEGQNFVLKKVYCNFKIVNDGPNDALVYEKNNLIARVKVGEDFTFRDFQVDEVILKTETNYTFTNIRVWFW